MASTQCPACESRLVKTVEEEGGAASSFVVIGWLVAAALSTMFFFVFLISQYWLAGVILGVSLLALWGFSRVMNRPASRRGNVFTECGMCGHRWS
jgi:hypothetical protein